MKKSLFLVVLLTLLVSGCAQQSAQPAEPAAEPHATCEHSKCDKCSNEKESKGCDCSKCDKCKKAGKCVCDKKEKSSCDKDGKKECCAHAKEGKSCGGK